MEAKVQGVGRFSAALSAMTVDMVGHSGIFGRLNLPKVKVKKWSSGRGDHRPSYPNCRYGEL
jgi:hypothetical protein